MQQPNTNTTSTSNYKKFFLPRMIQEEQVIKGDDFGWQEQIINAQTKEEIAELESNEANKFQGYCYFCDYDKHSQNFCPLKQCKYCFRFGHSSRICKKNPSIVHHHHHHHQSPLPSPFRNHYYSQPNNSASINWRQSPPSSFTPLNNWFYSRTNT